MLPQIVSASSPESATGFSNPLSSEERILQIEGPVADASRFSVAPWEHGQMIPVDAPLNFDGITSQFFRADESSTGPAENFLCLPPVPPVLCLTCPASSAGSNVNGQGDIGYIGVEDNSLSDQDVVDYVQAAFP